MNVDNQLDFEKTDLDVTFKLRNSLQIRLDDILEQARKKATSLKFPGQAVDEIQNHPWSTEKNDIKTEVFFIDNSLRKMFNPEEPIFFRQPSTDDRKDFEINVSGNDLIVFKSPTLTTVNIAKKNLKNSLENITEDLNLNIAQLETIDGDLSRQKPKEKTKDHNETIQKITILKNLINKIDSESKENIEKQIHSHKWISKLIEDQLKQSKTYYTFGSDFENYTPVKKVNFIQMWRLEKENYFQLLQSLQKKD